MESRFKLLGHPIHPMLVIFPVGLLLTAAGLDFYALKQDAPRYAGSAHTIMGIGILVGVVAAAFGWADWTAIPQRTRAKRIGAIHGVTNMTATLLFSIVWLYRHAGDLYALYTNIVYVEAAGVLTLLVGGWLGGELVDRLGIGVDERANVNAPNSLTRHP